MNRLYAIESMPTSTGSRADHRVAVRPSEIQTVALALAAAVGVRGLASAPETPLSAKVAAIAKDLAAHRGQSLVIAGDSQPPLVHALSHAMNEELGNVGKSII